MPKRSVDLRSRRMFAASCATALFAFLFGPRAGAQDAAPPDYFDVNADRSSLRSVGGETVLELIDHVVVVHGDVTLYADHGLSYTLQRITKLDGNVKVIQGQMTMTGDDGEYRQDEDLAILRRHVRIVDPQWVITCDEARYSRRSGQAWLIGNVVARDSASVLTTDRLLYTRESGRAEAFGSVELTSKDKGLVVHGRHGIYNRETGEGVIDRDPELVSGPDDAEPVNVVADTMKVYPDSSRATAYYRVRIIKGNTVTQCDSAMVYDDQKRVELFGKPIAQQNNVTMMGDRMIAYYNEDEIYRVDVEGNAEIIEAAGDSLAIKRDSRIRGNEMTLHLHGNGIDSLRVKGNASCEYFPYNPRKVESNSVRGQQMFFRFGNTAIDYVDVSGKADGVYRYVNLGASETGDSLRALEDTTLTFVSFDSKADKVAYAAEHVQYLADRKQLVLEEGARVRYRNSELEGKTITYYYDLQLLDAEGSPVLTEDAQKLLGQHMGYDMDSRTGLVTEGSTKYEQGFYSGENMAKVGENEMKVWNSWYTTCDLAHPHYHFSARTMKVYPDDKVFTGPIWLHIGETPVFVLPFMANSISRGRSSGFLRPDVEFGISSNAGRFIRNIGYYWATNDYTDFTFVADFNEDRSWRVHVQNRYALRYVLHGGVNYSYFRDLQDQSTEWTLDESHSQNLGERFTLDAQLRFVSSDDAPQSVNTIDNVNRYIDRSIRSTVSVRKSWDTVGFSASASRTQNLNITDPRADKLDMTLPDVSLSIPSRNLYFGSDQGAAQGVWQSLLKNTRYSPSLSANRKVNEKLFERSDITSARAGLGFSSPQRVRFVTLSPTLGMNLVSTRTDFERDAHVEYSTIGGVTDTIPVSAIDSLRTDSDFSWNMGANANTNFFGTFYPHIGRLRGIRHTLTPSVSYSYTPARNDRPRAQSVALGLRNSIDIKVAKPLPDTARTGQEEELQKLSGVVIWNLSTRYTPDVPQERAWSTIASSFNTVIAGANLSLNHTVDPYRFDILNTSATANFSFRGSHPFGRSSAVEVRELNAVAAADSADTTRVDSEQFATGGVQFSQTDEFGVERPMGGPGELALQEGRLPWSLNLGLSYSKGSTGSVSSTLRVGWDIKLTDNWTIDYATIYDIETLELNGQHFGITRDLHCWAMSFSRQQLGDEWQYYFRITLKAHPDLYGESGDRGVGSGLLGQF